MRLSASYLALGVAVWGKLCSATPVEEVTGTPVNRNSDPRLRTDVKTDGSEPAVDDETRERRRSAAALLLASLLARDPVAHAYGEQGVVGGRPERPEQSALSANWNGLSAKKEGREGSEQRRERESGERGEGGERGERGESGVASFRRRAQSTSETECLGPLCLVEVGATPLATPLMMTVTLPDARTVGSDLRARLSEVADGLREDALERVRGLNRGMRVVSQAVHDQPQLFVPFGTTRGILRSALLFPDDASPADASSGSSGSSGDESPSPLSQPLLPSPTDRIATLPLAATTAAVQAALSELETYFGS